MVYKLGKYQVRSGNTVRRANGYWRQYRRRAFIVREHIATTVNDEPDFRTVGAFGEGDCMPDGVAFSLNKQNRWELPGVIENIIQHSDNTNDNFGVQMIQRKNVARQSNCVRVCASDGLCTGNSWNKAQVKAATHGFFQSESVLPPDRARKSKRRHKARRHRNTEADDTNGTSARRQIRYDVVTPTVSTSYMYHYDKTALLPKPEFGYRHRRPQEQKRDWRDCISDGEYTDDDYVEEETYHEQARIRMKNTFKDFLDSAHCSEKFSFENEDEITERETVTETSDGTGDEILSLESWSDMSVEESPRIDGTPVIFQRTEVTTKSLTEKYGSNFLECRSLPRKFILDISNRLQEACHMSRPFAEAICLVFVHDVHNQVNTFEQPVYRVSLKGPARENIETVFDYMETNVEALISRTIFYLESSTTNDVFTAVTAEDHQTDATILEQTFNWNTNSYLPNNGFLLKYFMTGKTTIETQNVEPIDGEDDFEFVDVDDSIPLENVGTCPICFTDISEPAGSTALKSCGHTFCNSCWAEYLLSNISIGGNDLKCPEFKCKTKVDPGTIISLLDYTELIRFASILHDSHVSVSNDKLWCPSAVCGRVLQVNHHRNMIAHCPCGEMTCVKCSSKVHWPADCDTIRDYNEVLQQTGDKKFVDSAVFSEFYIYAKRCPSCKRLIEKFGGCNSMICLCGENFCWGCCLPWNAVEHTTRCNTLGALDRYGTRKVYFTSFDLDSGRYHKKWYKNALEHRLNLNPTKLSKMTRAVKPLTKSLKKYLANQSIGNKISIDYESRQGPDVLETEKVHEFLTALVNMYIEMNKLIENAAVLLNSWETFDDEFEQFEVEVEKLMKVAEKTWDLFVGGVNCGQPPILIIQECNKMYSEGRHQIQTFITTVNDLTDV